MDRDSSDYKTLQLDAERAMGNMKTFENITKFHLYLFAYAVKRSSRMSLESLAASSLRIKIATLDTSKAFMTLPPSLSFSSVIKQDSTLRKRLVRLTSEIS